MTVSSADSVSAYSSPPTVPLGGIETLPQNAVMTLYMAAQKMENSNKPFFDRKKQLFISLFMEVPLRKNSSSLKIHSA